MTTGQELEVAESLSALQQQPPPPPPAPPAPICSRRYCKVTKTVVLFKCANPGCSKHMHQACCKATVLEKFDLPELPSASDEYIVVCTKKCYEKVVSENSKSQTLLWNKDGKNGPDDKNHSEAILLNWLCTPGMCDDVPSRVLSHCVID